MTGSTLQRSKGTPRPSTNLESLTGTAAKALCGTIC